jgi:hypothetical protein
MPCLVLDAMGVIFKNADDVAELFYLIRIRGSLTRNAGYPSKLITGNKRGSSDFQPFTLRAKCFYGIRHHS